MTGPLNPCLDLPAFIKAHPEAIIASTLPGLSEEMRWRIRNMAMEVFRSRVADQPAAVQPAFADQPQDAFDFAAMRGCLGCRVMCSQECSPVPMVQ